MKMTITNTDLNDILLERELPQNFKSEEAYNEKRISIEHPKFGSSDILDLWFEGIHITKGHTRVKEDLSLKVESNYSVVEMHFALTGNSMATTKHSRELFHFKPQEHNLMYAKDFEGFFNFKKQNETNEFFEVHFTEDYFKRFASIGNPGMEAFFSAIEKGAMTMVSKQNMSITPQMNRIISEIINSKHSGLLKRLFIESKAIELFMLQVAQLEQQSSEKKQSMKAQDIEKIHYARTLLEQNISNPYTLVELAHEVGLNDFKLKKGFKEVFNTTVFGYLHELRMQKAKHLLLDQKRTIAEVADYCGYEYVQHFITAFRKKFGITPGKFVLE
ncbi:AraC family transcriptional regulator [Flavobacterium sp. CAU 1735]|uniref:helix-turn-helix domain-containing protein n=1 Tax=Flavobacterium sp. CAU 1735 TaxID=3140361 RepID=UPI0032608388